jgi:DNA-binding HxlR family transcriptional regulator
MSIRQDWSCDPSPLVRALHFAGDPWTMRIVMEALNGARRYEDFRASLKIADNILSQRLRQMVENGLLERGAYRPHQRTPFGYSPTDSAKGLLSVLDALSSWGEIYTEHL